MAEYIGSNGIKAMTVERADGGIFITVYTLSDYWDDLDPDYASIMIDKQTAAQIVNELAEFVRGDGDA